MIALGVLLALALQNAASEGPLITSTDGLRNYAVAAEKRPEAATGARFRIELPVISDHKTDIGSLQSPAGWSFDAKSGMLVLDVDFGAITPLNYANFDKQHLAKEPPLRTVFFDTRAARDSTFRQTADEKGDVSATQGWLYFTQSFGLAVPTSASAYGVKGGDLPDDFTLPLLLKTKAPNAAWASAFVRSLRLRFEGRLRTLGGQPIMCGRDKAGAYAVDEFTQRTPDVIVSRQCFLPATLERISLVRVTGGPPLTTWTRRDVPPTPETADTAVIMAGDRRLAQNDIMQPVVSSSPNATLAPGEPAHGAGAPATSATAPASPVDASGR